MNVSTPRLASLLLEPNDSGFNLFFIGKIIERAEIYDLFQIKTMLDEALLGKLPDGYTICDDCILKKGAHHDK